MRNNDFARKVHNYHMQQVQRKRERKRKNPKCGRQGCSPGSIANFSYQITQDIIWKKSNGT